MTTFWARLEGSLVAEIVTIDPTSRFTPDIIWQIANAGNTSGGDPSLVTPRWTYTSGIFYPEQFSNAVIYTQSSSVFKNVVVFTGNVFIDIGTGQIDESCWLPLATTNISATNTTAHFVSYSTNIYDNSLVIVGSVTTPATPVVSYVNQIEFVNGRDTPE